VHFRTREFRHAESILNTKYRLKKEMMRILQGLELQVPCNGARAAALGPHRQVQQAFLRHGWEAEVLVSDRTEHRQHFDLYKDRVAIEIEFSSRERLYRDYLRFQLAEADGRIDVGVILMLDDEVRFIHPCGLRNGLPRVEDAEDDLKALRDCVAVPIWLVGLS
jgi:hypothetical protein